MQRFGLLAEIYRLHRTDLFTLAAPQAVLGIQDRFLGNGRGKRHADSAVGAQAPVEWARYSDRTLVFAIPAAGALRLVYIARFFQYGFGW
jgi:hypothetical protein